MKNIIKYLLIFVIGGLVMSSCEDQESNWDAMTNPYDKNNANYYIQFLNATGSFVTEIDDAGQPTTIETIVGVALLGAPQSSAITITLVVDPSSTMTSNMYTLSDNSIVIPAGGTSGSVSFTSITSEMPEDETVNLVINMDAGGAEASSAYQLNYAMKRLKFCPLTDLNDLVGKWDGTDSWGYETAVETSLDGENMMIMGLNHGWMEDAWVESIEEEVPMIMTMNPNGTLVIDKQYCFTTDYEGAPYRYEISGSGIWDNCKKTMVIDYVVYYEGDSEDLGYPITEDIALK